MYDDNNRSLPLNGTADTTTGSTVVEVEIREQFVELSLKNAGPDVLWYSIDGGTIWQPIDPGEPWSFGPLRKIRFKTLVGTAVWYALRRVTAASGLAS